MSTLVTDVQIRRVARNYKVEAECVGLPAAPGDHRDPGGYSAGFNIGFDIQGPPRARLGRG